MRPLKLLSLVLVATCVALAPALAENRVALVIGDDAYQHIAPLEKARADAKAYSKALRDKGFRVREGYDLSFIQLNGAIAGFVESIQPGDTAVFVYSGHGWSDGTQNYLVSVDAPASASEDELAGETTPIRNGVNGVLDRIERKGAGLRVAIIDACRDNPFTPPPGQRGYPFTRGLAPMAQPPQGTFVVFSASAGQSALDRLSAADADPNSVFTRVFLPYLSSDLSLQEAVKASQAQVAALARTADHDQKPSYWDEVLGPACLTVCQAANAPAFSPQAAATPPVPRPDETAWSFVQMTADWRQAQAFIDRFPESAERQKAEALRDMLRQKEASLAPGSLPAASAPSARVSRRVTIGFSQVGHEGSWRPAFSEDMQEEAMREGIDLRFADAQGRADEQLKAVRAFIDQKVDAIVIAPVLVTGWDELLQEAKRASIPIFLTDRDVAVADRSLYVTRFSADFNKEGWLAGSWLAQASKGTCNIVELQGTVGSAPAIDRKKGFEAAISRFPRMRITMSQSGDFTTAGGKRVTDSLINATNRLSGICAVFAHNDNMLFGAIQAMKEAGLRPGKDILMVSIDYVTGMKEALAAGDANASVELTAEIGKYVYPVITKYLEDKRDPPKWVVVPSPLHTAENSGG
jgi:simple sugar transport system substrate-binding protein